MMMAVVSPAAVPAVESRATIEGGAAAAVAAIAIVPGITFCLVMIGGL